MNITIVGAGSWGTALGAHLSLSGHRACLLSRTRAAAEQINLHRENRRYLPGIELPETITTTSEPALAFAGAEVVIMAVPSGALRDVMKAVTDWLPPIALLVSAVKGLEDLTGKRMSEVVLESCPNLRDRFSVISGPNLAFEVARRMPGAAVSASFSPKTAELTQKLFMTDFFRVYTSSDVIGVELSGAMKNVVAIGAGISDGLGFGDNSKAVLMTRGLAEIRRLGISMGADGNTFLGLAGVGDLMATGASRLSRNYRVGFGLAHGTSLERVLKDLGQVAEGVPTSMAIHLLASRFKVEMPIVAAIHSVLYEGVPVEEAIKHLLVRPPRSESDL